jgi:guanine deaminase
MFKTMARAHEVTQLRTHRVSPFDWFSLATLGGAKALGIDAYVGNFLTWQRSRTLSVIDLKATH